MRFKKRLTGDKFRDEQVLCRVWTNASVPVRPVNFRNHITIDYPSNQLGYKSLRFPFQHEIVLIDTTKIPIW